jgi:isopentenyl-diphosphate Delta-isomerase
MKIPIVDENDEIVTHKERENLDYKKDIYRVASLWINNSKGEILLARRAFTKKHSPGKWGPAVAGTVEEGETYESNIIKEAEEEIGLKNIAPQKGKKERISTKYNYFAQRFHLNLDKPIEEFKPSEREVAEMKWFSKEELKILLDNSPEEIIDAIRDFIKEQATQ